MAEKTLFVKIASPVWISEIHQQGPIVTPIEVNTKLVLGMVRKGYKVTAVDKFTKKEVKLTVLNATDPFKKEGKVEKPVQKPINPNIGAPVMETPQVTKAPVVEEVKVEVPVEAVVTGMAIAEEAPVVDTVTVVAEEKPFNYKHNKKNHK